MATTLEKSARSEVARHIARVAARLFATEGYDATAVRAIVEAAGVTKPTLYYHFGSKEGLAQALLTVPMSELLETLRTIVAEVEEPVAMLEGIFEAHFAFCREEPDRVRFAYTLKFGPLGAGRALVLDCFKGDFDAVMEHAVRRMAEGGVIDPARAEAFATACHGMIVVSTLGFLYRNKDLGPDLAGRLVGDLLHGFGMPRGPVRGA